MRTRAEDGSPAQVAFFGVRTILVPPDIVAVPRRSPVPAKKRTPWHPQPDGQVQTERSGARQWFSDRLFVEQQEDHTRSGFSTSIALHVSGAAAIAAMVVAQAVHVPVVRARHSLVMPAIVSASPTPDILPAQSRAREPKPARSNEGAPGLSRATTADPVSAAHEAPAPIEAPSTITPETIAAVGVEGATDSIPGGVTGGGIEATTGSGSGSGSETNGPYRVGGAGGIRPPRKIKDVKPAFPLQALTERAHGSVVIEATIGADGHVKQTAVVHSVATLDQAALDAVRQWEYMPSMINGIAVAVVMLVVVNFTIQ
jgi:periplasmic protein TonB